MPNPSSLFARSDAEELEPPVNGSAARHPSAGGASSLFARTRPSARAAKVDDIADDLLVSRLTRLRGMSRDSGVRNSGLVYGPPAPASDEFDDLDDLVALDLFGDDVDGDPPLVDDLHDDVLDDLLDLDALDAQHAAEVARDPVVPRNGHAPPPQPAPPRREPSSSINRLRLHEDRMIRNRWDVTTRRLGLDRRLDRAGGQDRFSVSDRAAAESLACLVEWLLARPAMSDLARAGIVSMPRGLFSLEPGTAPTTRFGLLARPAPPLDRFTTFET